MNNTKDEYDYQVLKLTEEFYKVYPNPPYKEIVRKKSRPYNCLLIESSYGYFICVPYRTHINHDYAFKFKSSVRSMLNESGLDYSKTVIIRNCEYIGTETAIIDKDEYEETRDNIEYIVKEIKKYISDYINFVMDESKYDKIKYNRIYRFSTLKYFHKELGIIEGEK